MSSRRSTSTRTRSATTTPAACPGRNELDATQELNWPAVAEAIIATGFKGHFAHEFIPKRDPMTSLGEAVTLCDV